MFTPHSQKQEDAIFCEKPFNVVATGIQYGKTTIGAWWLRNQTSQWWQYNHIVTAPSYKILNQATLPAFMDVFRDFGIYRKVDQVFELHGGGNIYIRSETDPDSIVGITNVKSVWGDEAGLYRLYFWQNMQARAARLNGKICLTTSPYSLNWIYKELIKPTLEGKRDDVHLTAAKSIENPYFSKKYYEDMKRTMSSRRFNALFNGTFEKMQGLVYDCFSEELNQIQGLNFNQQGIKYYAGVDWGFNDPFVILIWAILPNGKRIQVSEFYKTGLSVGSMIDAIKSKSEIFQIESVFCDPSRPDMILELQNKGIPAIGADNSMDRGIQLFYELIKSNEFLIMKDSSPYTVDEFNTYHWPEPKDLKPDQDQSKEKPVDQNNHCMDAARYLSIMTYYVYDQSHKFKRDPDDIETIPERIARLKKPSQKKYERWQ